MGLADHPMGVVGEARLMTLHTSTHIQQNILIFRAEGLETCISTEPEVKAELFICWILCTTTGTEVNNEYTTEKNEVLLQDCPCKCPFFSNALIQMAPTSEQASGKIAEVMQLGGGLKSV